MFDFVFLLFIAILFAWFVLWKKYYIHRAIMVQAKVLETEYSHNTRTIFYNHTKFEYEIEGKKYQTETTTCTKHKIGNTYEIKVDPMNYEHIISVKDYQASIAVFVVFLILLPFIIR